MSNETVTPEGMKHIARIRHSMRLGRQIEKIAWHDNLPEFLEMLAYELVSIAGEYWILDEDGIGYKPPFPHELTEGANRFQKVITEAAKDWNDQ